MNNVLGKDHMLCHTLEFDGTAQYRAITQVGDGFYRVVVMTEVMTVIKIMLQMALSLQNTFNSGYGKDESPQRLSGRGCPSFLVLSKETFVSGN